MGGTPWAKPGLIERGPEPEIAAPAPRAGRRSYEAAAPSRHHDTWLTRNSSADTEIFGKARTLRDRSRHLVRNNPFAAKAVGSLVSNIVGEGIVPRPVTGSPARDKQIRRAFNNWAFRCDAGGQLDFYGIQTLLCREMIEGGEVLLRKRLRRQTGPRDVPLELQVLEADFLDPFRNGMLTQGAMAIQGVEISIETQKRLAYWLYPQHPGNLWINTGLPMVSAPVPADEVLHVYEQQRTQTRGVPWGTPAIESLQLLADYELAEIVRKKVEACTVGFVINAEDETDETIAPAVLDADGNEVERFEPGMIARLRGGKDVKFNAPTAVGGYGEYKVAALQTIAAAYRMPYELVSGDLSQVNFSSMRGGLVEFRRLVRTVQWHILIQMALQPIWEWWCETAYLAGVIDAPVIPVQWAPPKFEWVDPMADAQAASLSVRNGFRSWQDVVAESGRNPDDVLDELHDWNVKLDDLGIVLDSDPRRTSVAGLYQPVQKSAPGEEPELSRPNRGAQGRGGGRAAATRAPRRPRAARQLRRGLEHDRDRLDHGSERPPLLVVGR
ncbi:phage portal protein [Methylorubrum rhodesianum]|uniref:phage portal protein n=1 Tax=Methylorubrum TaxID=2282523 RepID=UPI0016195146|nr:MULTISPECIES: phage portal protein [Methylorubrum]MBB5765693.1 lambda family phage portal protein [Methylorubrum rhodesianum]